MFGIELVVPFLIFAPRRLRLLWMRNAHCPSNFHPPHWQLLLLQSPHHYPLFHIARRRGLEQLHAKKAPPLLLPCTRHSPLSRTRFSWLRRTRTSPRLPLSRDFPPSVLLNVPSSNSLARANHRRLRMAFTLSHLQQLRPFRGDDYLAARDIVEGSNDGVTWFEYDFKYKPGVSIDAQNSSPLISPDWIGKCGSPRLSDYRRNPWFVNFCVRFCKGPPEVLGVARTQSFPQRSASLHSRRRLRLPFHRFLDSAKDRCMVAARAKRRLSTDDFASAGKWRSLKPSLFLYLHLLQITHHSPPFSLFS